MYTPAFLLTTLEKNGFARMNTGYINAMKSSFASVLTTDKVIIDISHDLFILLLVAEEHSVAGKRLVKIPCPALDLKVYRIGNNQSPPALLFFYRGDQVTHTRFTHKARISPQWLSDPRRL